jgi:copper resistance protein C
MHFSHRTPPAWRLLAPLAASAMASLAISAGTAWAHARPQTLAPQSNARLDAAPAHIVINYDDLISPSGSALVLLDASGNPFATAADPVTGNKMASVSPTSGLTPGAYTVDWTSVDATDGHTAQGFYTFVVNGGPIGIINGLAQNTAAAADLIATLTVTAAGDGSSLLRVDLNNTTGVERVRIRLSRPDLGEDLLDTQPSGDGGWVLNGNDVAVPGQWHAVVIVRRAGIFDDARAPFDFSVDPGTGTPSFS